MCLYRVEVVSSEPMIIPLAVPGEDYEIVTGEQKTHETQVNNESITKGNALCQPFQLDYNWTEVCIFSTSDLTKCGLTRKLE